MADRPQAMGEGVIYDRGYRRYEGTRAGRASAMQALFGYSLRRMVGIGKRWTAKILPFFLYVIAFGPPIALIGIQAVFGIGGDEGGGYADLFGLSLLVVLVFGATAAPELLCDDRRQGVLPLYFSRAITRGDYLLAKLAALATLLLTVTALPMLLLYVGNVLLADAPLTYARQNLDDPLRLLALSALISVFYAAIGLAIAANIDRKGIAAAVFAGVILVGSGVVAAVFEAVTAGWRDYLLLLSPGEVGAALTRWLLETPPARPYSDAWYLVSVLVAVVICAVLLYRRYLRED